MKYIDLTRTLKQGMPVFPGDPAPELKQIAFIGKNGYNSFLVTTGMHAGTHIDAPLHMLPDGKRLSEYPVGRFFGKGHLIDARGKPIEASLLEGRQIAKGDIVLVMTGFSGKFGTPEYYGSFPAISQDFALRIIKLGASIVGVDAPSVDRPPFAVHKLLLGNDVLIIENLANLENLSEYARFAVIALPAKLDCEAAPARVAAQIS